MNGYNFTERVRKCLALAREEAHALGHEYVGTEYILLGLIRDGGGVASAALDTLKVDSQKVRQDLLYTVKPGKHFETVGPDLPYTSRAKKVLELSMETARQLNHSYVGTEHVLMGLIREEKGVAAQVLRQNGLNIENVRTEILTILGSAEPSPRLDAPFTRAVKTNPVQSVLIKLRYADGAVNEYEFNNVELAMQRLLQELMD